MMKIKQPIHDGSEEIVEYIQLTECVDNLWNNIIDESELRANGKPIFKDKEALHSHLTNAHYKGNLEGSHQEARGQRAIWVIEDCVLDYLDELVKRHENNTSEKAKISGLLIVPKGLINPSRYPKNVQAKITAKVDSLLSEDAKKMKPRRSGPSVFARAIKVSRNAVTSGCNAVSDATKRAVTATRNAIAKPFRAIAETIESNEDKGE